MTEIELREKLKSNLDQLLEGLLIVGTKYDAPIAKGRQSARADMIATVRVGARTKRLVFEIKQRGYPMELERGAAQLKLLVEHNRELVPVLAVPFLSESGRRLLRSKGINYLDLSGNAFMAFDNVLLHKSSPANVYKYRKEGINIFADKASLILRELLANPTEYCTVRGLAEVTRNSVGWTSEVLRDIEERGYLERKLRQGCRLKRIQYLLNDWTDAYDFQSKNRIRNYFIKAETLDEILMLIRTLNLPAEVDYALTLHAGAHLVAPFTQFNECHLHVSAQNDFERQAEFFVKKLNLLERETGGNLHIIKPFYRKGAMYGARLVEGLKVVSDLQLYLDLYRFQVRGREQAEKVLEKSGLPNAQGWV